MRISDWSSDVCSSDLEDADTVNEAELRREDERSAPFGVPAFQVRTAIGEEVYPRDVATFHHDVERALPGRIIAAVDDGRSGSVKKFLGLQCILIAHRLEELIAVRLHLSACRRACYHQQRCCYCCADRSEEHTSELKSLMRNS